MGSGRRVENVARFALYAAVALAAALGGGIRYGVSVAWLQAAGDAWPWPTLIVNVFGSFLIALWWRLFVMDGRDPRSSGSHEMVVVSVMTGFCGGLTTFSMFGVETLHLIDQARWAGAAIYLAATGAGALGAAWLALSLPRRRSAAQ